VGVASRGWRPGRGGGGEVRRDNEPSRRIVEVDPHNGHIVSQMEATALGIQPVSESNGRFTFLTADQETGFLEIVDVKLHWLVVRKNAARGRATLTLRYKIRRRPIPSRDHEIRPAMTEAFTNALYLRPRRQKAALNPSVLAIVPNVHAIIRSCLRLGISSTSYDELVCLCDKSHSSCSVLSLLLDSE